MSPPDLLADFFKVWLAKLGIALLAKFGAALLAKFGAALLAKVGTACSAAMLRTLPLVPRRTAAFYTCHVGHLPH